MDKKNKVLTTMSTLTKASNNLYYYKYGKNPESKIQFCDGISALEPGSKYFLSRYDIDEIIVIASDQTIIPSGEKITASQKENFFQNSPINLTDPITWENLQKLSIDDQDISVLPKNLSACELYKYRIAEFLNQSTANPTLSDNLSKKVYRMKTNKKFNI